MRGYELMVIVHPELDDDKVSAVLNAIKQRIAQTGQVCGVDLWGRRRLAYPLRKMHQGVYALVKFNAPPESIVPLRQFLRIEQHESVLRYLVIVGDLHTEEQPEEAAAAEPKAETVAEAPVVAVTDVAEAAEAEPETEPAAEVEEVAAVAAGDSEAAEGE